MDPTSREDLSALMDGELLPEPTRFLLRRLDHDPELSATWSRWHLIRACLTADPARASAPGAGNDFAGRVAAALQAESRPQGRRRHWVQYVGGGAIAAGVAVAALLLNAPNPLDTTSPVPVASRSAAAPGATLAMNRPAAPVAVAPTMTPPWLLARQPTVLGAQPASANVVYGTGLLQPDYLRRASDAREAVYPFMQSTRSGQPGLPFSIVLLPVPPPASSAAAGH